MSIDYTVNAHVSIDQFADLLRRSTLAERRPVEDVECLKGMMEHSTVIVSAWHGSIQIGIARSITDFHYACYLSDLAVDPTYQRTGVEKKLQVMTQEQLGPRCKLIVIRAPDAQAYYEHIGFARNQRCWVFERDQRSSE